MDASVLDLPVRGRNLRPGTLRDQLGPGPVMLVFLRHFGCLFCREVVRDVRRRAEVDAVPRTVFVHQGDVAEGDAFFARVWPEAAAVSDPGAELYRAFGVERGNLAQMFGPSSFACAVRAAAKGNGVGRKVGDGWTLPTVVLLAEDGSVAWEHHGRHAGDHHVWDLIPA
ncbi:MAG: SelL-related redox protein [Thermoleophilia bacterium]